MGLRGGGFENAIHRGKAIPVLGWIAHGRQIESCDLFKRPGYFVVTQQCQVPNDANTPERRAKFCKAIPLASQKQRKRLGTGGLGERVAKVLTWSRGEAITSNLAEVEGRTGASGPPTIRIRGKLLGAIWRVVILYSNYVERCERVFGAPMCLVLFLASGHPLRQVRSSDRNCKPKLYQALLRV